MNTSSLRAYVLEYVYVNNLRSNEQNAITKIWSNFSLKRIIDNLDIFYFIIRNISYFYVFIFNIVIPLETRSVYEL